MEETWYIRFHTLHASIIDLSVITTLYDINEAVAVLNPA